MQHVCRMWKEGAKQVRGREHRGGQVGKGKKLEQSIMIYIYENVTMKPSTVYD